MSEATPNQPGDPTRFREVERVFRAVIALPAGERASYLAEACAADPSLRAEVEALLAEDTDPLISTFHWSTSDGAGGLDDWDRAMPPAPEIPGFTIGQVLGVGGMGIVYEAEQHKPRRRVALKVLRPGLHSPERLRRFEAEGEFLARLTHPGIAQIHDAGATDDRRPYFAMEFIDGPPITEHVRSRDLSTNARLRLFLQVCDAVQFAHQNAVIHRDIKPSNILVTGARTRGATESGTRTTAGRDSASGRDEGRVGGVGVVKVLDFGIARAADTDLQAVTLHTDTGQLLGTLPYMSPEQASGDPALIDTRTDVYSLGLLLFELLTGQRPRRLDDLAFADALQAIRSAEPTRLGSVNRALRGDLETIVGKALERDRDRRYDSVSALADDIRRHLHSEPITARPPSAVYQLRKFAHRNRAIVTGVAAIFVVLAVALVVVSMALSKASAALDEARRQARISDAVNEFLNVDLLGSVNPDKFSLAEDVTVRAALERAAETIEGRFDDEPHVEANIRYSIATAYFNLGLYALAESQIRDAIDLYTQAVGPEHPDTFDARNLLAFSMFYADRLEEAVPIFASLLEDERRVLGDDDPRTLDSISGLGDLYANLGDYAAAEPLLVESVERGERTLGFENEDVLSAADSLAQLRYRQGNLEGAAESFRRVLDARTRLHGPEASDTLATLASLALTLHRLGRHEESLELSLRSVEAHRRLLGPEHPDTQTVVTNLGLLYMGLERYDDAERLIREVMELRLATVGEMNSDTLVSKSMLARVLLRDGRFPEAEPLAVEAAEGFIELRGPDHPYTLIAIDAVIELYEAWGRPESADPWRTRLPSRESGG